MVKKAKKKMKDKIAPKQITWDEFLKVKDKYIGKVVELTTRVGTFSAEVISIKLDKNKRLTVKVKNCYKFNSEDGWGEHNEEPFDLFSNVVKRSIPVDHGSGTIEIVISGYKVAYLKQKEPKKRA